MSKIREFPSYLKSRLENFNYRKQYETELVLSKFSSKIDKIISTQKITKRQIANRIGVSPQSVSRALRAEQNLTVSKMVELALAVDCQISIEVTPCEEIVYFGEYSTNGPSSVAYSSDFQQYVNDLDSSTPQYYYFDEVKTA